jgi:hypothetical protein
MTDEDVTKAKIDVERKLKSNKINISKTTDEEVEVLLDYAKMSLSEVLVDSSLCTFKLKQNYSRRKQAKNH